MTPNEYTQLTEIHHLLLDVIMRENKRPEDEQHLDGGVCYLEFGVLPLLEAVIKDWSPADEQ